MNNEPLAIRVDSDGIDRSEVAFHSGELLFEDQVEEPGFEFTCCRCSLCDLNGERLNVSTAVSSRRPTSIAS